MGKEHLKDNILRAKRHIIGDKVVQGSSWNEGRYALRSIKDMGPPCGHANHKGPPCRSRKIRICPSDMGCTDLFCVNKG